MATEAPAQAKQTRRQTVQQRRAQYAWACIEAIQDGKQRTDYTSTVRKAPSLIISNGLGLALAFLLSKGKNKAGTAADAHNPEGRLYLHLQDWLCDKEGAPLKPRVKDAKNPYRLVDALVDSPSSLYRQVTTETLAILEWLKRFAEARSPD